MELLEHTLKLCMLESAYNRPNFVDFSALEAIGNNLQKQYERWQPRARYRQSLDPTVDEVRRLVRIHL